MFASALLQIFQAGSLCILFLGFNALSLTLDNRRYPRDIDSIGAVLTAAAGAPSTAQSQTSMWAAVVHSEVTKPSVSSILQTFQHVSEFGSTNSITAGNSPTSAAQVSSKNSISQDETAPSVAPSETTVGASSILSQFSGMQATANSDGNRPSINSLSGAAGTTTSAEVKARLVL